MSDVILQLFCKGNTVERKQNKKRRGKITRQKKQGNDTIVIRSTEKNSRSCQFMMQPFRKKSSQQGDITDLYFKSPKWEEILNLTIRRAATEATFRFLEEAKNEKESISAMAHC